jgi:hypothetical protein
MKLRCSCCGGMLGMLITTVVVYVPDKWWFEKRRFCSRMCKDMYLAEQEEAERQRNAVSALYAQPQ